MDFHNLDFKQVLVEEAWEEYEKGMNFFYLKQLVPLNVNIYLAEKISDFPFDLLFMPEEYLCFGVLLDNIYQVSLLTITRIAADKGNRGKVPYTLTAFKNWVCAQVRAEYDADFKKLLRSSSFDSRTKKLLERATKLRNVYYAHLDRHYKDLIPARPDFEEIKYLRDVLNLLLDTLSFNVEHMMLPVTYHPDVVNPAGVDSRSDIERVLDSYARESALLNAPERNPHYWQRHRKKLSEQQLDTVNAYRQRLGLLEA